VSIEMPFLNLKDTNMLAMLPEYFDELSVMRVLGNMINKDVVGGMFFDEIDKAMWIPFSALALIQLLRKYPPCVYLKFSALGRLLTRSVSG